MQHKKYGKTHCRSWPRPLGLHDKYPAASTLDLKFMHFVAASPHVASISNSDYACRASRAVILYTFYGQLWRLKYCISRSCFSAAVRVRRARAEAIGDSAVRGRSTTN